MSRIGRMPVVVPSGVDVTIDGAQVTVKGPKGELKREVPAGVALALNGGELTVTRADDSNENRAKHGMMRALVANMVKGVTDGFERKLEINGVGYRADVSGQKLNMALGFSHPVVFDIPPGIDVAVDKQTHITVTGIDRQQVGQVAANIRRLRKPDPYKNKGVRYAGERLKKKVGKTGAK